VTRYHCFNFSLANSVITIRKACCTDFTTIEIKSVWHLLLKYTCLRSNYLQVRLTISRYANKLLHINL